jgi:menaquinone-dependent protoporphyrinogen oxidase
VARVVADRILVAYATRYGSTAEVARSIAHTLRQAGLEADVRDVREVGAVGDYDAVVFGAPIFLARMLRSGRRFVAAHRRELSGMRVAVFFVGVDSDEARQRALRRVLARRRPTIEPLSIGLVGGIVDGEKLRFRDKTPPIRKMLPGGVDMRDWDAVHAWAASVAEQLGGSPPATP